MRLLLSVATIFVALTMPAPAIASEEVIRGAIMVAAASMSCPKGTVPPVIMVAVLSNFQKETGLSLEDAAIALSERGTELALKIKTAKAQDMLCDAARKASVEALSF